MLGVGVVPFATPRNAAPYDELGEAAIRAALNDAGIGLDQVQQVFASYVYGDSVCGQRVVYRVGTTGVPIVNVNNNCASGSSALFLARQLVESGAADCVLAVGFEQMQRGALKSQWDDRPDPIGAFATIANQATGAQPEVPIAAQFFGGAGVHYAEKYGTAPETFAAISVKSRRHAANNPHAVFRDPVTVEEVLGSPRVFGPLTRLQCCPPTCGAAAVVVASEDFVARHGGDAKPVRIRAQAMTSDTGDTFDPADLTMLVGYGLAERAAQQVYAASGVDPRDVDVVELHDCFTVNELISYESLGLVEPGGAEKFVREGDNTYGGRVVTNPSGGLLSKGHPLGATGLAQCAELVWQLRGQAEGRQVDGARLALQHNLGIGGAAVVTLYEA